MDEEQKSPLQGSNSSNLQQFGASIPENLPLNILEEAVENELVLSCSNSMSDISLGDAAQLLYLECSKKSVKQILSPIADETKTLSDVSDEVEYANINITSADKLRLAKLVVCGQFAAPILIEYLNEYDDLSLKARILAIQALEYIDIDRAALINNRYAVLLKTLQSDTSSLVRCSAAVALNHLAFEKSAPEFVKVLQTETDSIVRQKLARLLADAGEDILLQEGREQKANSGIKLFDSRQLEIILTILSSKTEQSVRIDLIRYLQNFQQDEIARNYLLSVVENSEEPDFIRAEVVRIIDWNKIEEENSISTLHELLGDWSSNVRYSAAITLTQIDSESAIEVLEKERSRIIMIRFLDGLPLPGYEFLAGFRAYVAAGTYEAASRTVSGGADSQCKWYARLFGYC